MGIQSKLLSKEAIIFIHLAHKVSLDELSELDTKIQYYLKQHSSESVDLVIDLRNVKTFPRNLIQIKRRLKYKNNPMLGWTILVMDNSLPKFIGGIVASFFRVKFRAFSSIEDTFVFLEDKQGLMTEPQELKQY